MSNDRNDYGFPLCGIQNGHAEAQANACNPIRMMSVNLGLMLANKPTPAQTKLQRAQAIAAEVRARRFPPVQRIEPKD